MSILFMRLGLGAAITFPFYITLRLLYQRQKNAKAAIVREVLLCLFVLFMGGLIVLVLWPGNLTGQSSNPFIRVLERLRTGKSMNLIPLYTIRSYFTGGFSTQFVVNIVANVLMFSPMGFCLPLFWRRFQLWRKLLVIGILFSAGIETAQLFTGRSVDIDDLILNVAGVMLGYAVFALVSSIIPHVNSVLLSNISNRDKQLK